MIVDFSAFEALLTIRDWLINRDIKRRRIVVVDSEQSVLGGVLPTEVVCKSTDISGFDSALELPFEMWLQEATIDQSCIFHAG